MNTCNFCSNLLVNLQVSEPCKSTVFIFDPNTLSLVLVVSAVDRHIGLSIANACLAFLIRAWMSTSVPPFLLTILLRYVNSSTSSIRPLQPRHYRHAWYQYALTLSSWHWPSGLPSHPVLYGVSHNALRQIKKYGFDSELHVSSSQSHIMKHPVPPRPVSYLSYPAFCATVVPNHQQSQDLPRMP